MSNGWIKCSERLPEAGQRVLVYWEPCRGNGVIDSAIFNAETEVAAATWRIGSHLGALSYNGDVVDFWQPLPAPPAAEDGK